MGNVPVSASRSSEWRSPKARSWPKSPKPRARHHRHGDRLCAPAPWSALPRGGRLESRRGTLHCSLALRPGSPSDPSTPVRATLGPRPRAARLASEPVEDELERWLRWPRARRRGLAGWGARAEGSGRAGRRPLFGLRLLRTPAWEGVLVVSSPPSTSAVALVWPLWRPRHACGRRAGQGRAGTCPLR